MRVQLGWCKFGQNLTHLLFHDFLWILRLLEVTFDFIVSHLLLVSIAVWNLVKLVTVITVDHQTCAFNIVEAFVDCCPNLVLGRAIIIFLQWIDGILFAFGEG